MPFASKKQRGYLYAKKPEVAAKFAQHSNPGAGRAGKKKQVKRYT